VHSVSGAGDDVGVVGGGHDGATARPVRGEEADDGSPGVPVLADGGLVGEHELRTMEERRGDREPPLLAARELPRVR
jgi:hypothetical protein